MWSFIDPCREFNFSNWRSEWRLNYITETLQPTKYSMSTSKTKRCLPTQVELGLLLLKSPIFSFLAMYKGTNQHSKAYNFSLDHFVPDMVIYCAFDRGKKTRSWCNKSIYSFVRSSVCCTFTVFWLHGTCNLPTTYGNHQEQISLCIDLVVVMKCCFNYPLIILALQFYSQY